MTLSPWRASRKNLCSHQASNCPVCPRASGSVVGRRWLSHAMSRPGTCQVSTPLRQSPPREQFRGQGGRRAMRTEWEWCSTVHLRSSQRKRTTWTALRSVSTTPRLQCMALHSSDVIIRSGGSVSGCFSPQLVVKFGTMVYSSVWSHSSSLIFPFPF